MRTIPEVLKSLSEEKVRGFTFLQEDGNEIFLSFSEIYKRSLHRASVLKSKGFVKGDRIAIIIPDSKDFILTFYGAVLAGIIPVPIYPPFRPDMVQYLETAKHILKTSKANALATIPFLKGRFKKMPVKEILTPDELEQKTDAEAVDEEVSLDDIAFIQFTSGSTSNPKGVMVTHRNIAHNVRCFMDEGMQLTPDDVGVSWLPLYHDMGLIGFVFGGTYKNIPIIFMPSLMFIKRTKEWLRLITKYKATITFAPNFAYGLCTARIKDTSGLDLSSIRAAGCGSEPISYDNLINFARHFKSVNFKENSLLAAYGMAESTLAISFSPLGEGIKAETIDADKLYEEGISVPTEEGNTIKVVSCGKPFKLHDLAIMNKEGDMLPERQVGEVVVRGPSVTQGYYDNEKVTKDTIVDGWLHTGDLGYIANGDLYVCGRKKEIIIIAGRNYYPQDIEWAVNSVKGIRRGNVIAFGLKHGLTESVAVTAEYRGLKKEEEETKQKIKNAILDKVGIRVDTIELLPPGSLPKTSSGKLQRKKTQELYQSGKLKKKKASGLLNSCIQIITKIKRRSHGT
jgi:fatty-acyl-CoA synthase